MKWLCFIGLHRKTVVVEIERTPSAENYTSRGNLQDTPRWLRVQCGRCEKRLKAYYVTWLTDDKGRWCVKEHFPGSAELNLSPKRPTASSIK